MHQVASFSRFVSYKRPEFINLVPRPFSLVKQAWRLVPRFLHVFTFGYLYILLIFVKLIDRTYGPVNYQDFKLIKFWFKTNVIFDSKPEKIRYRSINLSVPPSRIGFGRLCSKKKHIMLLAVLIFLEIMPKLCYFLKIMLSVTEIMLLRFYTDFKENKDHQ